MKRCIRHAGKYIAAALAIALVLIGGRASADPLKEALIALQNNDYETAARLFRPLAEQGVADAQVMFGELYNVGKGVPLDHGEAVKWYRLAAKQGDPGGQDALGLAYQEGAGVPRNYVHAYMWYSLAAGSGDAYADSFAHDRDNMASKMTAAQIAEAQAQASKCQVSNFKDCE